jgi:Galactose oxidase, central domain
VLVAGGGGPGALASAELYDPNTGTWSATGSLNAPRNLHTATLLRGGLVLVAGGGGTVCCLNPLATAELYDPATGSWSATGSLNTGRIFHTATLTERGNVLVAGGDGPPVGGRLASAERYHPATGIGPRLRR